MSLKESLEMLSDELTLAAVAPDKYPVESINYESNKEHIVKYWLEAKSKIKRDLIRAQEIDQRLQEMFTAFEAGEHRRGQDIALELWGSQIKKLR